MISKNSRVVIHQLYAFSYHKMREVVPVGNGSQAYGKSYVLVEWYHS